MQKKHTKFHQKTPPLKFFGPNDGCAETCQSRRGALAICHLAFTYTRYPRIGAFSWLGVGLPPAIHEFYPSSGLEVLHPLKNGGHMSEDSKLDPDIEQILQIMYDFVFWLFEISDADISAAIQNYEVPFEPWNLWGLFSSFLTLFIALGVQLFGSQVR